MTKYCYIFDIDGTLADCSHRLHHIEKTPKDWSGFFGAARKDTPIAHMTALSHALADRAPVIFVSGRSDECRADTADWLDEHTCGVIDESEGEGLYMRKAGDHRDDSIVKIELLERLRADGWEPIMVFEDRARVVKAWRAAGVPCCQVADGDF